MATENGKKPRQKDTRPPGSGPRSTDVRAIGWNAVTKDTLPQIARTFDPIIDGLGNGGLIVTEHHRVLHATKGYARLVGYEQLLIENVLCYQALGHENPCKDCLGPEAMFLDTGMITERELTFQGNTNLYEVRYIPLHLNGDIAFVKIIRDVEHRRKIRKLLRYAEIGKRSAGLAHNLNNMLTVISSTLAYVRDKRFLQLPPESLRNRLLDAFTEVDNAVDKAIEITKHIMQLATGKRQIRGENVREVIDSAVFFGERIAHTAGVEQKKNITIKKAEIDENLFAMMIRQDVETLILNLIDNAIRHGFDEGDEGLIAIRAFRKKGRVLITVSNNGREIDEKVKKVLLRQEITEMCNHGIGLYHSKHLLEEAGGELEFASNEKATVFAISLEPGAIPITSKGN